MPQKIKIASQAHEESLPEDSQGKEDEEHTRALIHKLEKLILHHLTSFSSAFSLAFRLPHTPTLERKRLVAALLLIDQIKVDSPVYIRAQTYAAVINMIQYLNYMRDAFPGIVTLEGQKIEEFVCHFDLGILLSNIDNLNFYLTNAVQALNQAVAVDDRHSVSHTLLKVHEQVRNIKDSLNERDDELFLADFAHRFLLSAQCKDLQAE